MSLSKKTFALFLLLGMSICVGGYIALKLEIQPAFEDVDREFSEEALGRVTSMLDSDLRALKIMNVEYSLWDQTYAYAKGEMPEYASANLDPNYWHSVNIHLMMIFDAEGKKLYSHFTDPEDGSELAAEEQLLVEIVPGPSPDSEEGISGYLQGVINTRSGIMQVVTHPILTSKGEGPIAGTLVVGQLITEQRIEEFGSRATTKLSLYPISDTDLLTQVPASAIKLLDLNEESRIVTDSNSVRGYQVLLDVFGAPVAIIEVAAPPRIARIGERSIRTVMIALVIASSVFLLTALVFLQKLITDPIERLTGHILDIKESGDLNVDFGDERSDEIGVLATEFGQLTRKLGSVQTDLESARDEALASSKAKSDFLARMSHEIRTPMNGVLGMAELLRDTQLDEKQHRFAKTIYESGESLLHIINDILDISKIEAGKIELDIAPFDLQNMVEECLDLLAESAHNKGLELLCDIPRDTHIHVRGDPARLRQVLINLVGNAVKFTDHGEVIVRVKTLTAAGEKQSYSFEIEDTGLGISPENAEVIFEPFTQEDGSLTRRYGGTGLGLAISKQLVELMGGEIGVKGTSGSGCTFWFTTELEKDQTPSSNSKRQLLAGKSALIVDDNSTNIEILTHRLEGWDIEVQSASSGDAALEVLSDSARPGAPFDIMLLDMAMPGMDGLQLAQAIRKDPAYADVPIAMLSSISRNNVHEESTAGPDDWLAKPVRQARLHDTLVSLLGRADRQQGSSSRDFTRQEDGADDAQTGLQILLVDDNDVNLLVAGGMLRALGHQFVSAAGGAEAVETFKKRRFDAVLMDCRMPGMDGFEATRMICEWESQQDLEPTPIIALTAHALQGDREHCLAAGMSDYLSKPFKMEQLDSVLSENTEVSEPVITPDNGASSPTVAANDPSWRVLVVEDNHVNQQVARAMLEGLGYASETADDGDAALAALESSQFDLILMDCHMPGRDGYDATREIRQREQQSPGSTRIPIIALTADFLETNRQRCRDAGMDDYITKPFTQAQLQAILDRWLSGDDVQEAASVDVHSDGFSEFSESISLGSINAQTLEEIRQLDTSPGSTVLRDIVVSYCASSSKLILQLRNAISENDTKLVEQLAHCLKGGSGQLGATLLATICDEMIFSAKHSDLQRLGAQFDMAATEHCAVLAGLDKTLQNLAA